MSNSRFGLRTKKGLISDLIIGNSASGFLLDDFPNASGAYSLRKLRNDYTGPAIRVRRSNDSSEQDIGFINNELDTTSLLTFIGSNSGFITIWYDQSGNGRNITQSTSANQPRIVLSGVLDTQNGKPTLIFDGTNDHLINSTLGFQINNTSMYAISSRATTVDNFRSILSTGTLASASGFGLLYSRNGSGTVQDAVYMQSRYGNTNATVTGGFIPSINELNLMFGVTTISLDTIRYNGNEITTSHSRSFNTSNERLTVGARDDGGSIGFYHNGSISECVFWEANNQLNGKFSIENNINNYYNIF